MRWILLIGLALAGCKKSDPLAGEPAPVKVVHTADDDAPRRPVKSHADDDRVPGGGDDEPGGAAGPDKIARRWVRAARSDDILVLARLSPALNDPTSGATFSEEGLKDYYGKLLANSADWAGRKPEKLTADRLKKFYAKNLVDNDLRKATAGANYWVAAEGGEEPTVILLTVRGEYVTSAVEVPAKGALP